jgi:nicotinate-nucleotide--dimethylbenzimidazole phosphoribosyltransferase
MMLNALGVRPLLDLGLRLGEGSGGVLAAPLVRSAARLLSETVSLEEVLASMPS